jgi:hypothetical protein
MKVISERNPMSESVSSVKDVFTIRPHGNPTASPIPGSVTPVRITLNVEHAKVFRRDNPTQEGVVNIDLTRDQIVALYDRLSKLDYELGLRLPISAPGDGKFQQTVRS